MAYKYYSVLRPIAPGTFPKPVDNGVLQIYNYLQREEIEGIGKAYGFLFYEKPLSIKEMTDYDLLTDGINYERVK